MGLNAAFSGTYVFGDTGVYFSQGVIHGSDASMRGEYGELSDVPDEMTTTIVSNEQYLQWVQGYTNDTGYDDYKRAVTVPSGYGSDDYRPSYSDFVGVSPLSDVVEIPSTSPVTPPSQPDTPDTDFDEDFGKAVGELLSQPFDNLFPFCLIGDLRDFTVKIEAAFTTDGVDYSTLELPLSDFHVQGAESLEFDLADLRVLAGYVRPWIDALFVVALLVGTFRFFINRGGE